MRNALMNGFKNVLESYTTTSEMDGVRYCVVGRALVKTSDIPVFEKGLRQIKTDSTRPVGVSELDLLVSD